MEKFFYDPEVKNILCIDCNFEDHPTYFKIVGGEEISRNVYTRKFYICPKCGVVIMERVDQQILDDGSISVYVYKDVDNKL